MRLFSYLTKSLLPLFYDSFVMRLFSYLTKSILRLFYDSFVTRLFSYLTKSILPLIYDSFVIRLFYYLNKSILPLIVMKTNNWIISWYRNQYLKDKENFKILFNLPMKRRIFKNKTRTQLISYILYINFIYGHPISQLDSTLIVTHETFVRQVKTTVITQWSK